MRCCYVAVCVCVWVVLSPRMGLPSLMFVPWHYDLVFIRPGCCFTGLWWPMLAALAKVPRKQIATAVEFEWQKASFCGDCKLRSNYDCTAVENLRARCARSLASALSPPIGFQIFIIQSHRCRWLTAVCSECYNSDEKDSSFLRDTTKGNYVFFSRPLTRLPARGILRARWIDQDG